MTPNRTPVTIIIADDHPLFLKSLKLVINETHEFKVVAEAANGQELVELAKKIKPDIIITDIMMPVMDGIEAAKQIMKVLPDTKIIALTIVDKDYQIADMLQAGCKGYLLKDVIAEELVTAIKTVYKGETYFSKDIKTNVTEMVAKGNYSSYKKLKTEFSEKEITIIKLISNEYSNKEIADKLGLTKRSVEGLREHIIQKLGAKNSAAIVVYAIKNNLLNDKAV